MQSDANAVQIEATKAGVSFIEQLTTSKVISSQEVALFAAQTFGVPLLDLSSVDQDQLPVTLVDSKLVASKRVIPLQKRIQDISDNADLQEIYNTERHLLYVACTRARDQLLVTATEPASEFLDDLTKKL